MGVREARSQPPVGFLTVVEHESLGLFGGFLVLNAAGRPLEFHCTAPIKPNRAQQILYGPTLTPYLYGEQIGQTLVSKAETKPAVVCTDLPAVMAVREHVETPVVLVLPDNDASPPLFRIDGPHAAVEPASFGAGRHRLRVARGYANDEADAIARVALLGEGFDLLEPFARIREAIEEAQRGGR